MSPRTTSQRRRVGGGGGCSFAAGDEDNTSLTNDATRGNLRKSNGGRVGSGEWQLNDTQRQSEEEETRNRGRGGKKRRRSRGVVRRGRGRCRLVFIARPGVNKGAEAYYRRECSYIALPVFHPGHLPCTTRLILPLPPPPSPSPAPSTTAPPTAPPRVSAEGPRRRTRPACGKAGGGQPERTRPAGRGPSPEHARAVRLCLLSSLRRWARLCWLAPWPWPYGSNRIRNNFISISFSPRFLQCPFFFSS